MRYTATAPFALLLLLAACAVPDQGAAPTASGQAAMPDRQALREPVSSTIARLPAEAAGFNRGPVKDHEAQRPGFGQGVEYTTAGRQALASVDVYDRGMATIPDEEALIRSELDEAVRELSALQHNRTGRSLEETGRSTLALPNARPLQCAALSGRYGRVPVSLEICVGLAAGRFLKVQVTMPSRTPALADAHAFAQAVGAAAQR